MAGILCINNFMIHRSHYLEQGNHLITKDDTDSPQSVLRNTNFESRDISQTSTQEVTQPG